MIGTPLAKGAAHETRSDVCGERPGSGSSCTGAFPCCGTSGVVTTPSATVFPEEPSELTASPEMV